MTKKKKVGMITMISVLLAGVCAIIAVSIGALTPGRQQEDNLRMAGQIDFGGADLLSNEDREVAYVGKHIRIYSDDLEKYTRKFLLTLNDSEEARESALESLALREILYVRAREAGISVTEEAFNQWLQEYRFGIEQAENYGDFQTYVEGTGMTVEAYWESLKENEDFLKEVYGSEFLELLRNKFAEENNLTQDDGEYYAEWSAYLATYKKDAVEQEQLQPSGEDASHPESGEAGSAKVPAGCLRQHRHPISAGSFRRKL